MSLNYICKNNNPVLSTLEQILQNRGVTDCKKYLHTTDSVINSYLLLGEKNLYKAYLDLVDTFARDESILIVVDSDCDGYTSSAILINYLCDMYGTERVFNNVYYLLHQGKEHGLSDIQVPDGISLVIVPDAGSNDYEQHKALADRNIQVIVLDHHEAEKISEDAIVINNQLSTYPNKGLSGAGVTWQFCRYIDSVRRTNFAEKYLDLLALGNCADMMPMNEIETKHLINKGFQDENLRNPFILTMASKNSFSIGDHLNYMSAAFYIAPYVNAMVRSGTMEEKDLLFRSMLNCLAHQRIPSTKRGHKSGEMETLVVQAVRVATNVKNRQGRAVDAGMQLIQEQIERGELWNNKVIVLTFKSGQIDKNIAGLCANKVMSQYQRPCCVLIERGAELAGSARGYSLSGLDSFKDVCERTGLTNYCQGHANAFGISLPANDESLEAFINATNVILKDFKTEPVYYVDFEYTEQSCYAKDILEIAELKDYWGQQMTEPLIAIKDVHISSKNVTLMSPDKKPTLKITLPNGVTLLKFNSSQSEYEDFCRHKLLTIIGKCNANTWMGRTTAQVFIEDYEFSESFSIEDFDNILSRFGF